VGFGYDLRGNGKTAIRGSFGIFYNTRNTGNTNWTASRNPPLQFNPTIFYGNLGTLLQSSTNLFPSSVQGFAQDVKTPRLYSYTIGVQRDIGWNTVVDAAYVGTKGRHLLNVQNINTVPYGARFLPANQDPTRANTALPDNFFRPYPGYGDITFFGNIGRSDYDALQVQANRRFAHGFQFGVAYTLSKTKDYASTDTASLPLYQNFDDWSYALANFDQTHVAVINYTWDLPDASHVWHNKVVGALLDNWQLSGITAFASGIPSGVTLTTADSFDFSGGGDGTGVTVNGDPTLGSGDRSLDRWFDTSVFARPVRGQIQKIPRDVIRLPGIHVWDVTIFKNVPLGKAARYLQLRWEAYNVFNHTQFNGVDTTARFDAAGNQTNANFGRVTSTRAPRTMQASVRFVF
jgi:hypothetical protein